jgi:hypothetical protein
LSFFKKLFNRIGGKKDEDQPAEDAVQEQLPAPEPEPEARTCNRSRNLRRNRSRLKLRLNPGRRVCLAG